MNNIACKIPIGEIHKIGVNINQIAKRVNQNQGSIAYEQVEELLVEHRKVVELLDCVLMQHDKLVETIIQKLLLFNI